MNLEGVKVKSRSRWESEDPVLAEGEEGLELDRGRLKIGDGVRPWSQLPTRMLNDKITLVVRDISSDVIIDGGEIVS